MPDLHIDCDSHIIPKDAFDYVEEDLASLKPIFHYDEQGLFWYLDFPGAPPGVPGTTPSPPVKGSGTNHLGMVNLQTRLEDFDKLGIDQQLLVPQFNGWWSYLIEPRLATALARSHNVSILKLMNEYPGKFLGTALVALQDVESATRELEWAYENGFKTIALDYSYPVKEHPYGETLGQHQELWAFFKRAEELDMPLLLHLVQHGHRKVNFLVYQHHGLDVFAPDDKQMCLVSLITSGLLDDFPKLKIIYTEGGTAWMKSLVQRLDRSFVQPPVNFDDENPKPRARRRIPDGCKQLVSREVAAEKNKLPPSHYFKNNFYFTIETEEPALAEAVRFLGAEHFLYATDYPHDDPGGRMKFKDAELLKTNRDISESDKELIGRENARILFKLS